MTTLNENLVATDNSDRAVPARFDRADFDLILESRPGWRAIDFAEIYDRRDLLVYWTWRNIKARHAQSALGIGWAVIQPVINTLIFTVVFGIMVGIRSDGVPYPLFVLCGMVIWTLFRRRLREAVESLTSYSGILTKIYFPRLILPLSSVLGKLARPGGYLPAVHSRYALVPRRPQDRRDRCGAAIGAGTHSGDARACAVALGPGSAVPRRFPQPRISRFRRSCIFRRSSTPDSIVPERFRIIYGLNPVAGVISGVRAVVLGTGPSALGTHHSGFHRGCGSRGFRHLLLPQPRANLRRRGVSLALNLNRQDLHDVRHGDRR